jgi:hypothetical protein
VTIEHALGEDEIPSSRHATATRDPLHDRAQVRMFTLADDVAEEASGKLYISGAGLEWTGLPTRDSKIAPC